MWPDRFGRYQWCTGARIGGVTFFAVLGLFLAVADSMQILALPWPWAVVILGLVVAAPAGVLKGVKAGSDLRQRTVPVTHGGDITVQVGDLIANVRAHQGAWCAFGANDEFSVRGLEDNSAHWAFLESFFATEDEDARQALHDEAAGRSGLLVPAGAGARPATRHPYGAVVGLWFQAEDSRRRLAFLVANSTRGEYGFYADPDQVVGDPLSKILSHLREKKSHAETVVLSLIGTGHSRSHNKMQSVFGLIDTYLEESRDGSGQRLIKHLVISMPEATVVEEGFDLQVVHNYLDARAELEKHR